MDTQPEGFTKQTLEMLDLLPESSELRKIIVEAFLKRVTTLLCILLSKVEKPQALDLIGSTSDETDELLTKTQHANLVLWKLFSDTEQTQIFFAKYISQKTEFITMLFKLNSMALSGANCNIDERSVPMVSLTNTLLPMIMHSLPLCNVITVELVRGGHLLLILENLKKLSSDTENITRTVLLNLQIIYQCAGDMKSHSLQEYCLDSLEPLLGSPNNQIQLLSKAVVTRLNPTVASEVATLCSGEVETLLELVETITTDFPDEVDISLTNLLSIVRELLQIPFNQTKLSTSYAKRIFLELSLCVTEDLQPCVQEIIQIISQTNSQDTSMDEDTISDIDSRSIEKMDKGLFQLEDVAYSKTSNDLQGSEKMDESFLPDDTFGIVNTLLCYIADKNNQVSKLDVTVVLLLVADVISQSNDDEQAVTVEKIACTSYIGEVIKSVCHYLQQESEICERKKFLLQLLVNCLMEWTHYSPLLCKVLGKANVPQFLTSTLQSYFRSEPPSPDEVETFLQLLCTLLNFAYDATNLPLFDSCNIVLLLLTFARCPHFESALLSRIILSFLTPLLTNEQWLALKLDDVETRYFVSTLQKAIVSSDQEAEGYSILDLLKIITCFTNSCHGLPLSVKECNPLPAEISSEKPKEVSMIQCDLEEHSKMMEENISLLIKEDILFTLEQLIQIADENQIAAVALLLWNLLHFAPVKQYILKYHSSIIPSLHGFLKSSQDAIQQATFCALFLLETVKGTTAVAANLQYAEACYKHGHFKECVDVCNLVVKVSCDEQQKLRTLLLKGKSMFYLYQPALRFIVMNKQNLSKKEVAQLCNDCLPYIREVITLLGDALDSYFLDPEGSKLLDLAMMDCMREANQLGKCKRCLLCREQNELKKSHVWSESVIKQVSERKFGHKDAKNILFGPEKKIREPGTITYWMLCHRCEELLSQNGEHDYVTQFCLNIDTEELSVPYTSWLYNFTVGILFRTMSTLIFHDSLNSDEVYNAFVLCRKHLLPLPVKVKGKVVETSQLVMYQQSSFCTNTVGCLKPVLLVTPPNIAGDITLNMDYYSERYIDSGQIDSSGLLHFFMTYCNRVIIMLQFEPSYLYKFPSNFHIQPSSGVYEVPNKEDQIQHIPPGIWAAVRDYHQFHLSSNLEVSRCLPSHVAEKLNRSLPRLKTVSDVPHSEFPPEASHSDTKMADNPNHSLSSLGDFSSVCIYFLPLGFKVERAPQLKLTIPDNHQILLHTHVENEENSNIQITCFVGIDYSLGSSPHKTYFIVLQQDKEHSFVRADGIKFCVENNDIKVNSYLLDQGQNHPLQGLRVPISEFQEIVSNLIPLMLGQQGHTNIHALLHLATCNRLLQNQCGILSLDYRCSQNGCWYCANKCICCMKSAAPWTGMSIDNTGGFCSRLCKSLFSDDPTGNVSSIFRCSSEKSAKSLLLQGTVRPRGASLNVVDSLHLCLGESSCPQFGKPFIIWQFRKTNGQMFANSFLDESCSLRGLVWDSQFELDSLPSTLLLESLTDRITTKILFALNEEGFCDFHSWISCAHIVQAQGECEGKELSESALGLEQGISWDQMEELNKWLEKGISNVAYLSLGLGLENTASSAFLLAKKKYVPPSLLEDWETEEWDAYEDMQTNEMDSFDDDSSEEENL